ncbi:AEC family transporter [Ochrobactrum chromiisoli]|uniref:AEC family transporter n=1 Tax=Ochrobactrum chromiisoli TaxID=2993941 RepID=A0ABT3QV75_9HYPH|nr:AEC family transporter [Ochrobactrum chromiisoli]MCX2699483.1 AEC family transporter [Ochrobactrum chromiisoli]
MINDYLNVLVLFMVVGLGIVLTRQKWLDLASNVIFTKLLLNIALPATLILSISEDFTRVEFIKLLPNMVLPVVAILTLMLLSWFAGKLIRIEKSDNGLFIGLCSMSSTIFFGIPVTIAVYGSHGLPYALITYASQTVIYWTLGIYLLERDAGKNSNDISSISSIINNIINMPLIAFFIGVLILLTDTKIPGFVNNFLSYLGGMTSALAMLVVGTMIYVSGYRNIRMNRALLAVLIFRFIIAPTVVLLWGSILSIDTLMVKITAVICSLPIPNTTVILAGKYKCDSLFATESLVASIIIYLLFLPVILFFINMV